MTKVIGLIEYLRIRQVMRKAAAFAAFYSDVRQTKAGDHFFVDSGYYGLKKYLYENRHAVVFSQGVINSDPGSYTVFIQHNS